MPPKKKQQAAAAAPAPAPSKKTECRSPWWEEDGGHPGPAAAATAQPPPHLSRLESLPAPLHLAICACLPDDDYWKGRSRLQLSMVSKTLLQLYGGTLRTLDVHMRCTEQAASYCAEALQALVIRQQDLQTVEVTDGRANPACIDVLAQGTFRNIRKLSFDPIDDELMPSAHAQSLAMALQVPGTLQALKTSCASSFPVGQASLHHLELWRLGLPRSSGGWKSR